VSAAFVGVSSCCHSLMVVISTTFAFIDSCYGLMGGAVKLLIVWGVMALWEIMLCSLVFQFAEWQCCDGLNDLLFSLSNSSQIPLFQALLWLHMDSVQKHILRVYNQTLGL
jgi:hypothetical protein